MELNDLALIDHDLPLPDLANDQRFSGPDGVELWLRALIPHAARCEQVKNDVGLAGDPDYKTTSNFYVTTKTDEYSARKNVKPVVVEFAVQFGVDFSGTGLVTVPPPPPAAPIITGVSPLSGGQDQIFTVTGTRLAGVESVQLIPQMLGGSPIPGNILTQTETEITCQFIFSGFGPIRLNYSGGHVDSTDFIDNGA